jgi:hypothetical protein
MSVVSDIPLVRVLDPMERISETLFGLIMVLTFICSLGVATAGHINIQTMLIGALGCNLAWGIVDGGLYLLARINEQGGNILTLRAIRQARESGNSATRHRRRITAGIGVDPAYGAVGADAAKIAAIA